MAKKASSVNPWLIGAALFGTGAVVYLVARSRKPKALDSGSSEEKPKYKKAVISQDALKKAQEEQDQQVIENDPAGYTSFFTKASENIIMGDLEAWKIDNNLQGGCTPVPYTDDEGGNLIAYFKQARDATRDVLNKRYPDTSWDYRESPGSTSDPKPPLPDTSAPWKQWLFERVYGLAAQTVCDYVPPIT